MQVGVGPVGPYLFLYLFYLFIMSFSKRGDSNIAVLRTRGWLARGGHLIYFGF